MLPLLGENHRLPFFNMAQHFIWLEETKKGIEEFKIGYKINPCLNVNKAFRYQVQKCMYTAFGEITKPFIKYTFSKKNTRVLALIIFYETRVDNPKKVFRVVSCFIYTIIKIMSVWIIYLVNKIN